MVGDYVLPEGMINFQTPAQMVMEYMIKVQQEPNNEEHKAVLKALTEGAKLVVSAGVAQVEQGRMLIDLLKVNEDLLLWKKGK
jgi:hypothetical protein